MDTEKNSSLYEGTINISEIIDVLWKDKYLFTITASLITIFFVIFSLSIPNKYESSAILQLTGDSQNDSFSGLSDQYSGLASLAGISLPSSSTDKSDYVVNTLKSREFLRHILTFPDTKKNLMAVKSFNKEEGTTVYDEEIFKENKWVRKINKNQKVIPTYLEVHEKVYSKSFKVSKDLDSGFINISFVHLSPIFAKEFLDLLIRELNNISKSKDLVESETALTYLEEQLLINPQKDIRSSINQLIASQLNSKMLANVKDDYVIRSIDPPYIPEYKSSPDRALICIFGFLIGLFTAFLISISRHYYFSKDTEKIFS